MVQSSRPLDPKRIRLAPRDNFHVCGHAVFMSLFMLLKDTLDVRTTNMNASPEDHNRQSWLVFPSRWGSLGLSFRVQLMSTPLDHVGRGGLSMV